MYPLLEMVMFRCDVSFLGGNISDRKGSSDSSKHVSCQEIKLPHWVEINQYKSMVVFEGCFLSVLFWLVIQ